MKACLPLVLVVLMLFNACAKKSADAPPLEYTLTIGDSTITIPDSAIAYADAHFAWEAYMLREFQVASGAQYPHPGTRFTGTLGQWKAAAWVTRISFLEPPYSRDVKIVDHAVFYYEIGTYLSQFGYGWSDTYRAGANLLDPAQNIWAAPSDTSLQADNPTTIGFDGGCNQALTFRSMWGIAVP